ncbi:cytochrome P450 1B1 [Aplysia californica]|uniref:Cytochrome P450 1B1 n=1 Tax=Aplysia californica TaxID=6500 RepID=A0ABM0JGK9_APLCA|nr:cytochrome P450 1B1 [Aplysia californica]
MALELVLVGVTCVLLCTYLLLWHCDRRKYALIPMATPRRPLLGNAGQLDMSRCHLVLTEWAERFGPVFRIRVFSEEILVLSDYASVHDALVVQGSAFSGRPPMYRTAQAHRHRHSIVWQTYTEKLQFLRKEVLKTLKMYGDGMDNLEHKCQPEISAMLAAIGEHGGRSFDPWDHVYHAVSNVMLGLTLGTTFDHSSPNFQTIKDINSLFNDTFGSGSARGMDFLPWISKLRCYGYSKRLQEALKLRDVFWERELKILKGREETDCIVQQLLSLASTPSGQELGITETTAKEVFTNLILAGTDTTATALTCLLLVFLHYPQVQERMWEELNDHIGSDRLIQLADRSHMPYFQAALLELLRFTSHVALAVPHYTMCDTSVLGIPIPKNMTVYINLWALHHDPAEWADPWEFRPERFLDAKQRLIPPSHPARRKLMVFGAGRRVCLGEALAKNRLFLFAAALVQHFRFVPSAGDMVGGGLPPLDPRTYEMGLVIHPRRFKLRAVVRH